MQPLASAVLLLLAVGVAHAEVLGGGRADADCRMIFRGATATFANSGVVCTDGDPRCDTDGVANGTCHFAVRLCSGTSTSSCDTTSLSGATIAGVHLAPPHLPAPDGTCGAVSDVDVPLDGSKGTTVLAHDGDSLRDVDYMDLCCVSDTPTALDAARCALAIDLRTSGCSERRIPRGVRRPFARAGELVREFEHAPAHRLLLKQAMGNLAAARGSAKRLAKRDACGDALGLMVGYTQGVVGRARTEAARHS